MRTVALRLVLQPAPRLQVRQAQRDVAAPKLPALNIFPVALSPVKTANFESHYIKLQADSNYLLSEEYEVSLDEDLGPSSPRICG